MTAVPPSPPPAAPVAHATLRAILDAWSEWLAVAERLSLTLHEMTVAVTLRDVPRVERLTPAIAELTAQVRAIDERAVAALLALCEALEIAPGLRPLVAALPKADGQALQATANRIVVLEGKIASTLAKNRTLIEREMHYVDGTLTLIARASDKGKGPYRRRAATPTAVLMDTAA